MFGSLKKKLKEGVARLSGRDETAEKPEERPVPTPETPRPIEKKEEPKVPKPPKVEKKPAPVPKPPKEKPAREEPEMEVPKPEPEPEITKEPERPAPEPEPVAEPEPKKGRFARFREKVSTREITSKDIDDFFDESEVDLLQSNVAVSVIEKMKSDLKNDLVGKPIPRTRLADSVSESFRKSMLEMLDQGKIDIENIIKDAKKEGRPAVLMFLGYNGVGKTTTLAKIGKRLKDKGHSVVFAAADTFRSAALEQIEIHGKRLGIKVIKHGYGSDPAAVLFDAIEHAKSKGIDVVLADTAGRMHTNKNLADELKKISRVNKPDLKILVLDSLTGNDIVPQGERFNDMVGVDAIVVTKVDVDEKGGAIISASFVLKKPIIYITTGQEYGDIEEFDPEKIVKVLFS